MKTEIKFLFTQNQSGCAVMKADETGRKRMYLQGVSSGIKKDAHGERMTEKAISSFMKQANEQMILLYPDIHGIQASQDIGKLVKSEIMPNGDWFTEYRLYDEFDSVDEASTQRASKVWKQINGLPPYDKPIQKGFSIEGYIPDGAIVSGVDNGDGVLTQKVIDDVLLEGVVLVGKPAYQTGIANAVYKALGETPPWRGDAIKKSIAGELREMIDNQQVSNEYYSKRWDLQAALDATIEKIMKHDNPTKREELELAFSEFSDLMIGLIMQSEKLFTATEESQNDGPYGMVVTAKSEILTKLGKAVQELSDSVRKEQTKQKRK